MSTDTNNQVELQKEKLETFENRWKFAVFPAMVAFFILSGFGFYLIWGMLERMQALSEDIDRMTKVMVETLPVMQGGVVGMSSKMQWVGDDLDDMAADMHTMATVVARVMPSMEDRLVKMAENINQMSYATSAMAATTDSMGRNIWDMNRNISKPMSFIGDMMPWQRSNVSTPPPGYSPYQNYLYQYPVRTSAPKLTSKDKKSATEKLLVRREDSEIAGKSSYDGICASCHGMLGEGGVGPDLRTHTSKSINEILIDYKIGKREGSMTGVVKNLSEVDINNIAHFISDELKVRKPSL